MFRGSEVRRFANILATKMQQKKRPSSVFLFYHPNLPRANQGLSPLPAMLPIARNYPLLSSKFVWLMDFMDFMDFRHGFQHISRYYMSTYFNLFQPISTYFNLFQPSKHIFSPWIFTMFHLGPPAEPVDAPGHWDHVALRCRYRRHLSPVGQWLQQPQLISHLSIYIYIILSIYIYILYYVYIYIYISMYY